MSKKGGLLKAIVGVAALATAAKVGYDKYKKTKEDYVREEEDSIDAEIKKYNAIFEKKVIEVEDEEFTGCEMKAVGARTVLDLGLAVFEKDVYISLEAINSLVSIIIPEGVNVACDISRTVCRVKNLVENNEEDGTHTVYIIGKATGSNIEILPVNFYIDDDDDFEDEETFVSNYKSDSEDKEAELASEAAEVAASASKTASDSKTASESVSESASESVSESASASEPAAKDSLDSFPFGTEEE